MIVKLVLVLLAGAGILGGYAWRWPLIKAIAKRMQDVDGVVIPGASFYNEWLIAAAVGTASTVAALILYIKDESTVWADVGVAMFLLGALAWPWTIGHDETLSLMVTSVGVVWWTTGTLSAWGPVAISALYHVVVDASLYSALLSASPHRKLAGYSMLMGFLHYAFAMFITFNTTRTAAPFNPEVILNYNQWVRSGDSCSDSECIVYPVSTSYGNLQIGYIVALFSWISGSNHLVTALTLFDNNPFTNAQITGTEGNLFATIDWMLSASLMNCVIYILFEVPCSLVSLGSIWAATALTMVVGHAAEVVPHRKWFYFGTASVCYGILWVPIIMILWNVTTPSVVRTSIYDLPAIQSPPVEVTLFVAWLIATNALFPLVVGWKLRGGSASKCEIWKIILSAVAKLPLEAIYYGGILARRNTRTPTSDAVAVSESSGLFIALGVGLLMAAVATGVGVKLFWRELWE